jgi:hypothetical protein
MSCHFGRGVLVGGLIGVFAAMKWRRMIKKCRVYQKIEDMVFDDYDDDMEIRHSSYRPHARRCREGVL